MDWEGVGCTFQFWRKSIEHKDDIENGKWKMANRKCSMFIAANRSFDAVENVICIFGYPLPYAYTDSLVGCTL